MTREALHPREVLVTSGVRVTTPLRTAVDAARLARSREDAVVVLDMMLSVGLLKHDTLRAVATPGVLSLKAIDRFRDAVPLASERSASPQETRFRMVWILRAKLPSPCVNADVYGDDGRFLGRPDLLDAGSGLVGEFDGAMHRELARYTADHVRQERLEEYGLVVVRVTALDLADPEQLAHRLEVAHRRAAAIPQEQRRWRLRS